MRMPVPLLAVLVLSAGCGGSSDPVHIPPPSDAVIRADRFFVQDDPGRAREILDEVLAGTPDDFHARYRYGVLEVFENPDAAATHLERAAELDPGHPGPVFFQGIAAIRNNDRAGAEELMARAAALARVRTTYAFPDTTEQIRAALAAVERRRPREGTEALRDAAWADSSDAVLWFVYADAVYQAGDPFTAHQSLAHVLAARPDFPEALALDAACLFRLSRRPEARAAADSALVLDPMQPMALYVSGTLHLEDSEYLSGFVNLYHAVLTDPTVPEHYQYLGTTLLRFGSHQLGSMVLTMMEWTKSFMGRHRKWPGFTREG